MSSAGLGTTEHQPSGPPHIAAPYRMATQCWTNPSTENPPDPPQTQCEMIALYCIILHSFKPPGMEVGGSAVTKSFIPLGISSTESQRLSWGKWCVLTPCFVEGYLPSVNACNFIEDLGVTDSIEISCWIQHWALVSWESWGLRF